MRSRSRDERGSVTLFYVMGAIGMIVILGLALDLSGMVFAKQRAYDVAAQAARAGAEAVQTDSIMTGQQLVIDSGKASAAASNYIAGSGMTGSVSVSATAVDVTTRYAWSPQILGQFGIGAHEFEGHASARLVRAVQGTER